MNQSGTNIFEEYEIRPLIPIQGANKAGIMPDGSIAGTRPNHLPKLTLFERLFGKSASPTDKVGDKDITVSQTPRVGGILPDIAEGYKENRNTPISLNNFGQNRLSDGREKGFAYRLGEGLGSFAKFAESPAGRGLLMAGIVGATGGGLLPALAFGGSASLMNQKNRMKDQLYREALKEQGVDASNLKGYLGDDTFKNYSLANYRNKNLDVKMHLGTLSDNTKRAQLINAMLNNGELDPSSAMQLMNQYGIAVTDLDTSNQTKLLPYKQYAYQNGWNLGWANYGIKADKAAQEKEIADAVAKYLKGDKAGGTASQTVKVKAPNGKTGTIPIEQLEGALAAGYTRI